MKDIGRLLRDGDPVALEPEMSAADVQAVRRAVLAALATTARATSRWPGPLLAGTAVTAALAAGVYLGLRTPAPHGSLIETASTHASDAEGAHRQLQFASPGGTRIIWVFDPEFNP
jgi:hypothetical protein